MSSSASEGPRGRPCRPNVADINCVPHHPFSADGEEWQDGDDGDANDDGRVLANGIYVVVK
jgi:hypothetical protein